jgi:hypothetical protein
VLSLADNQVVDGLLWLWFDGYVIDVSAFDPAAITVNDPASGTLYQATGASVLSGFIVSVTMAPAGPSSGTQALLNASADSGIVDADTGAAWAGATDLPLPWP